MSLLKRINQYNAGIPEQLHEFKWAAMQESAFRFYRGTCHLFAEDFVKLYKYKPKVKSWICGDLHFENFGSYKGDNRQVYFDLNDFDEAILAGPEPEITRFLTSIIIAADEMNVPSVKLHKTLHDIMQTYTTTLLKGKALMLEADVAKGPFKRFFLQMSTLDRQDFIAKRTVKQKGVLLIKTDGARYLPIDEEHKISIYESLSTLLSTHPHYAHLVFEDAAIRIAGTGSLGLERYAALFFSKKKGKRYLVDIKQARASCYHDLINTRQPRFKNDADRILTAGNLLQFNSPALGAAMKMNNKWFVVKELQPLADKMAIENFKNDYSSFAETAQEMAVLAAYAHLRSSGRMGSSTADELMRFANKKQWQKDIIDLSGTLAVKNEKYYKTFCKAVAM